MSYRNPYIKLKPLVQQLKSANATKSDLKNQTSYFSEDTNCSAPVRVVA